MPTDTGPRRRLLLAIPELDRGGPDRVIFELARSLDRAQLEIHLAVVTPNGYYLDQLPSDVEIHQLGQTGRRTFDRYPGIRFARLTRALSPDVVMATLRMIPTAELASHVHHDYALVARVANHVTAQRSDESTTTATRAKVFDGLQNRGIRRAELVVAQSSSMAADLDAEGIPADRVRTIANPIDGAWVDGRTAEGDPADLAGSPRLLAVGRIEVQKGFDVLVRSLPAIRAQHPDAHLTVLGEGSQRPELEDLAHRLGVADAITFAGTVANPFLSYAAADLLVAPSRWEGLSNTVLEALATGLPVVATDGRAAGQDLVTSDSLGRLVAPDDPDAFAAAVLSALEATFDRAAIAAATRERFAAPRIVAEYAAALREAVDRRARRS